MLNEFESSINLNCWWEAVYSAAANLHISHKWADLQMGCELQNSKTGDKSAEFTRISEKRISKVE